MVDLMRCFVQLSRLSLWDYAPTDRKYDAADIMDALLELIVSLVNILFCITNNISVILDGAIQIFIELCLMCLFSQAASKGIYVDFCLELLVKHFVPPKYAFEFLKNADGVDMKNKVLPRVHAALKHIADLVPLAPLRLSPIVVHSMPKRFAKEPVSSICISSIRADATACCSRYCLI